MKCSIPEISWHNRDPVLSVDFQPQTDKDVLRLATGGTDTHVVIWYMEVGKEGAVSLTVAADLTLHQKAVNVVRWAPGGRLLASGDDEAAIIVWKQKTDVDRPSLDASNDTDREIWVVHKLLRGHLEDVYDISWCPLGNFLVSGSVDNSAIMWDVNKGRTAAMFSEHKGFVQGVGWDPLGQYIVTMSSDRVFRTFDINTKKVVARSFKSKLPLESLNGQSCRLYHDDTLQSFFRRLAFCPSGLLVAVPSGFIESENSGSIKPINAAYIYSRYCLKVPVCVLPCGDSPALAVRWSPVRYSLQKAGPAPLLLLPERMLLAVATRQAVLVYDTQQTTPLAIISNIHYTRLTDLSWSSDGNILVVSSTDGFISVIKFSPGELGEPIPEVITSTEDTSSPMEVDNEIKTTGSDKNNDSKVNGNVYKTPSKPKRNEQATKGLNSSGNKKRTPKSAKKNVNSEEKKSAREVVVMDEAAMEPWFQDPAQTEKTFVEELPKKPSEVIVLDDESMQDMKLVYEETQSCTQKEKDVNPLVTDSPCINEEVKKTIPLVTDSPCIDEAIKTVVPKVLPTTPRRVNLITLCSPKNKKSKN